MSRMSDDPALATLDSAFTTLTHGMADFARRSDRSRAAGASSRRASERYCQPFAFTRSQGLWAVPPL